MKLRFTFRDFILLLGVMVAMIIAVTTFFYRDSLVWIKPTVSKKIQAVNRPAVMLYKNFSSLIGED
jgi:hypothetical protein